jgi:hypothetical protein
MTRQVQRVQIDGPEGALEGLLVVGNSGRRGAALVCHPHPSHGGTMHSKTVHHAALAFEGANLEVLRFNFRGVGRSAGRYGEGVGEREDAAAALAWLERRRPGEPLLAAGFSFGSWVGLDVGRARDSVRALVGIAPPLALYSFDFLRGCRKPLLLVAGDADPFCPVASLQELQSTLNPATEIAILPGAGHLLVERLPELRGVLSRFASRDFPG